MGRDAFELQPMGFVTYRGACVLNSRLLAISISLLLHPTLQALGAEDDSDIQNVVVTANRIEQPLSRVGDSVTVISAQEQRRSQKTSVSDLLAMTPGVTVARNGGIGGTTTLLIRGAESHHTVVLIDGVKINDPSQASGGFNFADLLTNEYSQIEVLRGPQSTLWGSQAIGGVVNIVTQTPEGPLSGAMTVQGGSHETAFVRGHAQAGDERRLFDDRRHLRVRPRSRRPRARRLSPRGLQCARHLSHHGKCIGRSALDLERWPLGIRRLSRTGFQFRGHVRVWRH
jgi:outer membrane receptor protein involved in Fe transport